MQMLDSQFRYGPAEHACVKDNGYYIFDHGLSTEGLAVCRERIDAMISQRHADVPPDMMISTHQQESWVFELATEPKLLDMIEDQIGPNILLWSSHLLCKPPRTGELVPWHQDAPYWNVKGRFASGIWIAFDDMGVDNGAMSVIPGWHHKGTLPIQASKFVEGFNEEIVPSTLPEDLETRRVVYELKAGQMAVHDVMIPHSSTPNVSDRWRRVLVLRYLAADGQIAGKTYTNYKTGEPFNREFFLVRGDDIQGIGLRRGPFEGSVG